MNRLILLSLALVFSLALIGCGGNQVKSPDSATRMFVDSSNKELAKYPVEGFGYKSSQVPAQNWDRWSKSAAPVVKRIIDQLPEGYVLQVTGHTDSKGPERPVGNKPGNIKISEDRAKAVHGSLKRQGITSNKLTYKGVGSSELTSGASDGAKQRRVSFKVVPK